MEFEINLLTIRPSAVWMEKILNILNRKILFLVLLSVAGIVILVGLYAKGITKKTGQAVIAGQKILEITMEKQRVSSLVNILYQIQNNRNVWFGKLKALSEVTPDQIFLTNMDFKEVTVKKRKNKKDSLNIQGVINTSVGEDPSTFIQKFMKDLKNKPSFMKDFEDPVLVSVSSNQKKGKAESLDFEFQLFRK
ncbi:MAG: hypothetical protein SV062_03885 [Thermodesulfobacteriota bacterium]|nr:hypothetical protein [Thermodesulfobacteriota bacterium]